MWGKKLEVGEVIICLTGLLNSFSCIQANSRVGARLLESIVFIIDSVLPLVRKLPQSVAEELEQDLKQMIVRHSFLTVVHACIK